MRARIVIAGVLLTGAAAWAGWRSTIVAGTPVDVHLQSEGVFTVTSSAETLVKICPIDAGACTDGPSLAGLAAASVNDAGCLWGLAADSTVTGCGYNTRAAPTVTGVRRLRCLPDGFCAMAGQDVASTHIFASTPAPRSGPWNPPSTLASGNTVSPLPTLSGVTLGGVDYMLFTTFSGCWLMADGGSAASGTIPGTPISAPNDGVLFVRPDGHLGIIVALRDTAPQRERYGADLTVTGAVPTIDAGWLPGPIAFDPEIGGLKLVTYSESNGSAFGYGFGMGTQRDGGLLLAGPVPNPSAPGLYWQRRTVGAGQLPISQQLRALSCLGPRFCVALTLTATAPNVYVYWNEARPVGEIRAVPGPAVIDEGTSKLLNIVSGDPDGDPTWITWQLDGGFLTVAPDDAGSITATVTAPVNPGGACSMVLPITAVVSDGLAEHDAVLAIDGGLLYRRTTPDPFAVSPQQSRVDAGGSVTLTAIDGGCSGTARWDFAPDAGTLIATGSTATYTAPLHFCSADAGVVVSVSGQIAAGLPVSPPASATISVEPWGPPNPPMLSGAAFTQLGGSSVTYPFTGSPHACFGATDFPGVNVRLDAGALPPGISVTADGAGVTVASSDVCRGAVVAPGVSFELGGVVSPPAGFTVTVVPDIRPLVAAEFSMNLVVDAGGSVVHGEFTVDAGCLAQRGLLGQVDITGVGDGGWGPLPVPGPWSANVVGACAGGPVTVTAQLFEDGGVVGTETDTFMAMPLAAGLGSLDRDRLEVSCEGIDSTVSITGLPGSCPLESTIVTWTALDGGPAVQPLANGQTVNVRSVTPGLDGLSGQSLVFEIEANAGGGNIARVTRSVQLRPRTFVRISHLMTPVAASSDDVLTVSAELSNQGTCAVSGIMLEEDAAGLSFIAGSARIDGATVDATGTGGRISIGPFTLQGSERRTVSWLAKVRLLSTPRPNGEAYVAGFLVSEPAVDGPMPSGCGCESGAAGSVLLALLIFVRRCRRLL